MVTEYTLGDILRNKEANGHIIKWAVELGTYSIDFRGRQTIKSQVLADFIAEWIDMQAPVSVDRPKHWVMYFNGSLILDGARAGVFLFLHQGITSDMSSEFIFQPRITPPSTKLVSMVSVLLSNLALNASWYMVTLHWSLILSTKIGLVPVTRWMLTSRKLKVGGQVL